MIHKNEKKIRKSIASICLLALVFVSMSPIFAKKADAFLGIGDVVLDPANLVQNTVSAISEPITAASTLAQATKDMGLDAVAWTIVNLIIERMSASTVKWINSGFKGSPAFVENPEAFFGNMGDKIAGQFIFSSPNLNFLCGPLQAKIKLALSNSYTQYDRRNWQCSLTGIANNVDAFMNDFENGGWEGFFELSQGPQNPIGAYLQVEGEMMQQIANQKDLANKDLLQGKGFMSYKKCKSNAAKICMNVDPTSGKCLDSDCAEADKETVTPGSVISDQLNKQLGLGQDKLAVADEINEIVSALLNKLVSSVIGGIGSGLRGLSNPDSTQTGSPTFTSQLTERKPGDQIVGYFCLDNETDPSSPQYDIDPNVCKYPDTPNTDILNIPLPNLEVPSTLSEVCNSQSPSFDAEACLDATRGTTPNF